MLAAWRRCHDQPKQVKAAIRPVGRTLIMWGIIPAAGAGSRIQPLAFSKELLPVGSRHSDGVERPRAVSEYIVERMILGGATRICFVISPGKSDILEYFGGAFGAARMCYTVQPAAVGLCDAIFCALPFVPTDEPVLVGLPDTIWFPADGFSALSDDRLSFLLFPVERPELFDAVLTDDQGRIQEIRVKEYGSMSGWIWGAFKMPGGVLKELHQLCCAIPTCAAACLGGPGCGAPICAART